LADSLRSLDTLARLNDDWIRSICPHAMEMLLADLESAANACQLATKFYMGPNANVTFDTIYGFMKVTLTLIHVLLVGTLIYVLLIGILSCARVLSWFY
jgi:hypothetical protein